MATIADAAPADWLLQSAALAKSAQLCQLSLHATLTTPATKQLLLALVLHLKSASGRMISRLHNWKFSPDAIGGCIWILRLILYLPCISYSNFRAVQSLFKTCRQAVSTELRYRHK